MKRILTSFSIAAILAALLLPAAASAQKADKDKDKEKAKKEKTDLEQIIITHKGDKDDKVVLEFKDGKVIVNGKPADEFKDDDITVHSNKFLDRRAYTVNSDNWNSNDNMMSFNEDENRAMLGVTTEKADEGAEIQEVSKESAAEKAGLKVGDIITKVGDTKIEDADDLSKAVKSHKPGEKVTVTYMRDKKEQKVTAELGKWKGINFNFKGPDMNFNTPYTQVMPRMNWQGNGAFSYGTPKLGLSVQDSEDGKGVKVIEVDEESNAEKAGIKEDDIITHVNDKEVNSADEVAKIVKESKEKHSIMIKLIRGGKTENVEVKIPRKLKTADL